MKEEILINVTPREVRAADRRAFRSGELALLTTAASVCGSHEIVACVRTVWPRAYLAVLTEKERSKGVRLPFLAPVATVCESLEV